MKKTSTEKVKEMKDNFIDNCKDLVIGKHTTEDNFGIPTMFQSEEESASEEPKTSTESNLAKVNRFEDTLELKMRGIEDAVKELRRFIM